MKPPTDYTPHAARPTRKMPVDAAWGGRPQPDAEFHKSRPNALDEITAGLEMVRARD